MRQIVTSPFCRRDEAQTGSGISQVMQLRSRRLGAQPLWAQAQPQSAVQCVSDWEQLSRHIRGRRAASCQRRRYPREAPLLLATGPICDLSFDGDKRAPFATIKRYKSIASLSLNLFICRRWHPKAVGPLGTAFFSFPFTCVTQTEAN